MLNETINQLRTARATIGSEIAHFEDLKLRLEACIAQKRRELESTQNALETVMRAQSVRPGEFGRVAG